MATEQLKRAYSLLTGTGDRPYTGVRNAHYDTYRELWKTLWQAPKDSPIPYFVKVNVPAQRDGTCPEVHLPEHAWILKFPEAMAHVLEISDQGILLRDEIFVVTLAAMAGCDSKALWTWSPEDPSKGLIQDDPPLAETDSDDRWHAGIVVVGQPGIGKSTFLRVLLILLIHTQWPVIFQFRPDFVGFFSEDGVEVGSVNDVAVFARLHSKRTGRNVFALLDSTEPLIRPDRTYYVNYPPIFIVQTPSPTESRVTWIYKSPSVKHFTLKPWTLNDLLIGRSLQNCETYSEREIVELFRGFEPSARDAYAHNLETYTEKVQRATDYLDLDGFQNIVRDAYGLDYRQFWSHLIVTLYPARRSTTDGDNESTDTDADALVTSTDMDTEVNRARWEVAISGRETYDMLARALNLSDALQADRFYKAFADRAHSKRVTRFLLDDCIQPIFSAGGSWRLWSLKKSSKTGPGMQGYVIDKIERTSYLHISKSGVCITDDADPDEPTAFLLTYDSLPEVLISGFYQPPSFDAFIYDANNSAIVILQASVGERRELNARCIEDLRKRGDIQRVVYVVVTPPNTSVDIGVAHEVDWVEKYQITLDSILPQHF